MGNNATFDHMLKQPDMVLTVEKFVELNWWGKKTLSDLWSRKTRTGMRVRRRHETLTERPSNHTLAKESQKPLRAPIMAPTPGCLGTGPLISLCRFPNNSADTDYLFRSE